MEHAKLKISPIVEVVCEFRFAPEAAWDWTVPGLLAPDLAEDYPQRKEVSPERFTFSIPPGRELPLPPEWVRFLSQNELAMVQSGPRRLAINHLSPYPGWETFEAQILRALDINVAKCGWQPLEWLGLLYINRIETAEVVEEVLAVAPRTEAIPIGVTLSKFVQQWELAFDHSTITLTTTRVHDPAGYVVQLDASTLAPERLKSREAVVEWLRLAHETVYRVFEKSLTQITFERLKG